MKDVARIAGVSIQTVSAIINHKPGITQPTRDRVLSAIEKLGYHPYSVARSLRTRQTHSIALVVSDIANPFYATVASAIEEFAHGAGYGLMLHNTHNDIARETKYIQTISERWIDGAIIVSTRNEVVGLSELSSARIPVVAINHTPASYEGPSVTTDNVLAGRIAAEYLVSLGHKHISHIGGPVRLYLSHERETGFFEVLQENGLKPIICPENAGEWDCESGYRSMRHLLECCETRPTAVFAANDRLAIGAMRAIRQAGLQIPRDISVIGMDDIEYSAFVSPPLTTVGQPIVKMALTAVELLIKLLSGENPQNTRIILAPELIIRESTCLPPSL